MAARIVLLDRDGTINVDTHYLSDPDALRLEEGAAEGLRRLVGHGFRLVVVTNQSGIARGYFTHSRLDAIHDRLATMLRAEGVVVDGWYVCPHRPEDGCACRKPATGLVERAAADLGFDPRHSWMIGDKAADVELGRAVGARTVLVRTGKGARTEADGACAPDFVVDTLREAADVILAEERAGT